MPAKSNGTLPDKRRKYNEDYKAVALRLASESRSTQAAGRPATGHQLQATLPLAASTARNRSGQRGSFSELAEVKLKMSRP